MEQDFEFAEGEKVLAYSQGLLYEAKCLQRRVTNFGQNQYFIHYKGFKAKFDEWADESEVLSINPINLGHKKRLESRRKSEKSKRSQEPKREEASSSEPAIRSEDEPDNNVEQAAIPVVENVATPTVEDDGILVIDDDDDDDDNDDDNDDELISDVENEVVPVVNNEPPVQAVRVAPEFVFHNIPPPMLLANELRSVKLPRFLRGAKDFDRTMHKAFGMVLQFPEKNFVAEVLNEFTKSSYFVDDDGQKKHTTVFLVTLLKYFNASVHTYLTYKNEKLYRYHHKGMAYFRQRLRERPNINYIFKNHLNPRRIWCYLYGPVYIIRLIVQLPKILVTNSWHPDYDTNLFVLHIKQLMRFLEHNYDNYFSVYDYISLEQTPYTKNVFLRPAPCRH